MFQPFLLVVTLCICAVHAQQAQEQEQLTSTINNNNKVFELDVDNFEDAIQAKEWTCLLIYDPWDERSTYEQTLVMEGIRDKFVQRTTTSDTTIPVTFARLNGRKHAMLRDEYTSNRGGDLDRPLGTNHHNTFAQEYHDALEQSANALLAMTNETLLDFSLGNPYWPATMVLVALNYNVYGQVDLNLVKGALPLQMAVLDRWLLTAMQGDWRTMTPLIYTKANVEKENNQMAELSDNSFPFQQHFQQQQAMAVEQNDDTTEHNPETQRQYKEPRDRLRLLLENDSIDDGRVSNQHYFAYKKAKVIDVKATQKYLDALGVIVEKYLAWAEGYEVKWSPERKARQDEMTKYGYYLNKMNQNVQNLLDTLLKEDHERRQKDPKLQAQMRANPELRQKMQVPHLLRGYYQEMVFGRGRNTASFQAALDDIKAALGDTPEERRRNRYHTNSTALPLVAVLRDYLTVQATVAAEPEKFALVLAELATEWHNILREFHKNISKRYLQYLKKHPRTHQNNFQFQKMDVLDMTDPANHDILTNYDDFHARYTQTGTPVVLSNVVMTHEELTIDHLVDECRTMDVTTAVHISHKVGERAAGSGWGGLEEFVLPDSLLNKVRRVVPPSKSDTEEWGEEYGAEYNEATAGEDGLQESGRSSMMDRSLTMEQYAILAQKIENLYLHDMSLPENCDRMLYDETPYSKKQKFKLPSVVGGYDLFQRVAHSSYDSSWPSLFVGKKGSNSKLHIDSGGTGFLMYLVSGRKRWVVYNPTERVHVYERIDTYTTYPDVLGIGKGEESDDFFSERFPLLHRAEGAYEIIQEPGQLVYIPPSCPHAVENLEDIVGLAMNIVPREGVANHFHEEIHGAAALAPLDLAMSYLMFEDNADKPVVTKDPLYTTFAEYKSQY